MKIILIASLFFFSITCISQKQDNKKEYDVELKRSNSTILIAYKLDSSYKEVNAGSELWAPETARKYKKNNELIITFYHLWDSITDTVLEIGSKKRFYRYGKSENPFSLIEEYPTKFNNQKGYFIKYRINSKDDFILSYCTFNKNSETLLNIDMIGNDLNSEEELIFKQLIESFTFQKK